MSLLSRAASAPYIVPAAIADAIRTLMYLQETNPMSTYVTPANDPLKVYADLLTVHSYLLARLHQLASDKSTSGTVRWDELNKEASHIGTLMRKAHVAVLDTRWRPTTNFDYALDDVLFDEELRPIKQ